MNVRNFRSPAVARQGGFTLLELIAAIAVAAIVIGFVAYETLIARNAANSSGTADQVNLIQTEVRSLFAQPNYSALGTSGQTGEQMLINSGKAPQPLISGTGATAKLVNAWGAEVTLFSATYAGNANGGFQITYDLLPQSVCLDVANAVNPNFGIVVAGAHGGSGTTLKDDTAATPVVYSEAAAITACNNTSNTLVLTSN